MAHKSGPQVAWMQTERERERTHCTHSPSLSHTHTYSNKLATKLKTKQSSWKRRLRCHRPLVAGTGLAVRTSFVRINGEKKARETAEEEKIEAAMKLYKIQMQSACSHRICQTHSLTHTHTCKNILKLCAGKRAMHLLSSSPALLLPLTTLHLHISLGEYEKKRNKNNLDRFYTLLLHFKPICFMRIVIPI